MISKNSNPNPHPNRAIPRNLGQGGCKVFLRQGALGAKPSCKIRISGSKLKSSQKFSYLPRDKLYCDWISIPYALVDFCCRPRVLMLGATGSRNTGICRDPNPPPSTLTGDRRTSLTTGTRAAVDIYGNPSVFRVHFACTSMLRFVRMVNPLQDFIFERFAPLPIDIMRPFPRQIIKTVFFFLGKSLVHGIYCSLDCGALQVGAGGTSS